MITETNNPTPNAVIGCACTVRRAEIQALIDGGKWAAAAELLAGRVPCYEHSDDQSRARLEDLAKIVQGRVYAATTVKTGHHDDLYDEEAYYAQDIVENGIVGYHVTGNLAAYREYGAQWWSIDMKIAERYAKGIAWDGSYTAKRAMVDADPTCVTGTLRPRKIATTADLLAVYFADDAPSRFVCGGGGVVTADALLRYGRSPRSYFGGTYSIATEVKDALLAQGFDAVLCRDGFTWFEDPHYTIYLLADVPIDEKGTHAIATTAGTIRQGVSKLIAGEEDVTVHCDYPNEAAGLAERIAGAAGHDAFSMGSGDSDYTVMIWADGMPRKMLLKGSRIIRGD